MSPYPSPLKVGVFLAEANIQFLDVAPVDMLGMLQKDYIHGLARMVDHPLAADVGLDIDYYVINETGESPNQMSGGFKIEVTHSIQTCPLLDVLLIGGPTLAYRPSAAVQAFLQSQYTHVHAFITVCTGYTAALFAGILDGKSATAPQGLIPGLKKGAPAVKWVEKRWVRDGKVWTSGAVANGLELMAAFMRSEFPELRAEVEMVLGASDISVRGEGYGER